MKNLLAGSVLAASAFVLNAADYTTYSGQFTAGIDLKGGASGERILSSSNTNAACSS